MCKSHEKKSLRMPMLCSIYFTKHIFNFYVNFCRGSQARDYSELGRSLYFTFDPLPIPTKMWKMGGNAVYKV